MRHEMNLGFSYMAGSLQASSSAGDELAVAEIDPVNGSFAVELSEGFEGSVSIDFQRELLRGGETRPDQVMHMHGVAGNHPVTPPAVSTCGRG